MSREKSTPVVGFAARYRRSRLGMVGLGMLAFVVLVALLGPILAPYDPDERVSITIDDIYAPPGPAHWLGTDDVGQDILTNVIYGARVSLLVGFLAGAISLLLGTAVGLAAGFYEGRVETLLMRVTDTVLVIPELPLAVVIVALTRPSLRNIILVLGLLGWTTSARLVRAQTLVARQRRYVLRARAMGAHSAHILRTHILPQVLPVVIVNAVLIISLAILNESTLSFLGLADPTTLSWGQMLNFAFSRGAMSAGAWWVLVPPGAAIAWTVMACLLIGQGLEDAVNPRSGSHHLSIGRQVVQRLVPLPRAGKKA